MGLGLLLLRRGRRLAGKEGRLRWIREDCESMRARQACETCDFRLGQIDRPERRIVAGGRHYRRGGRDRSVDPWWRGFGGARRDLRTGETLSTTDLWCQGEIPERFRSQLPDTHEFV